MISYWCKSQYWKYRVNPRFELWWQELVAFQKSEHARCPQHYTDSGLSGCMCECHQKPGAG